MPCSGFLAIGSNVALMAMSAYLISKAAIVSNVAEIALAITSVRVLAIGRATFRYLERYVTHRATFAILADLRVWFFASIEPLAPARLATRRSGDLLARIVADIETLEDFYVRIIVPPVVAVLVTAFASVLLGVFDPLLGLALAAFLVLTGIVLPVASRRLSRRPAIALVASRAELSAMLVDEIGGIADLVAMDRAADHRERLLALGRAIGPGDRRAGPRARRRGRAGGDIREPGVGDDPGHRRRARRRGAARRRLPRLLPLVALASFEVIAPLSQAFALLDANEAAARRLFELTDVPPAVTDAPGLDPTPVIAGHAIEFRNVRFRYGPDEPYVLDACSFVVPSGASLAIVGPSGVGKSTLVNLLLRFWDYDEGEILIGGRELHELHADEVRRMLGVVAQDVHLFNATIRDNLALADADVTDETIVAACRQARIHDAIAALPDGYATRIGQDGLLLSGGERQRLAIARAIIKDAPILILDEATANLDVETERDVLAALAPFMAGRTTLVVSHRAERGRVDRTDAGHGVGAAGAADRPGRGHRKTGRPEAARRFEPEGLDPS